MLFTSNNADGKEESLSEQIFLRHIIASFLKKRHLMLKTAHYFTKESFCCFKKVFSRKSLKLVHILKQMHCLKSSLNMQMALE